MKPAAAKPGPDTLEYHWQRFDHLALGDLSAKDRKGSRIIFLAGAFTAHFLITRFFLDDKISSAQAIDKMSAMGNELDSFRKAAALYVARQQVARQRTTKKRKVRVQ